VSNKRERRTDVKYGRQKRRVGEVKQTATEGGLRDVLGVKE